MNPRKLLPILFVLIFGIVGPSQAAPADSCTFLSPLQFTGSQWQVKSSIGPIFLARLEGNSWRVLACFDGTKGKYFLEWSSPQSGVYAAIDSRGACSETLSIR